MTEGKLVGVRKSMRKFEVVHSMLDVEVCSVAKVMPCAINRQVMMALLSLGLDEQVRQPITVMVWSCTTGNVGKREEALESTVSAIQMAQHIHHASALQHLQEHACSISISGLIRTPVNTRTPAYGADAMQLCVAGLTAGCYFVTPTCLVRLLWVVITRGRSRRSCKVHECVWECGTCPCFCPAEQRYLHYIQSQASKTFKYVI